MKTKIPVLPAYFFLLSSLVWMSCGDIRQDLILHRDGSGTLETTFDFGEMMSMLNNLGDMTPTDEPDPGEESPADVEKPKQPAAAGSETPQDPMQALIEKVTDPSYPRDFDTLVSFSAILPDSVRAAQNRMDLVEKLQLRIKSPANSANMSFGIIMNFNSPAQLKELVSYLESMDNTTTGLVPNAGTGGLQSESFLVFDADMEAGWIRFDDVDYSRMAEEFGMAGDSAISAEDMGMMEMMFGSSKIKSVIHVPGEVISCTNPDAIMTKDDKVMLEYAMLDALKKKKIPGYQINFKPKK